MALSLSLIAGHAYGAPASAATATPTASLPPGLQQERYIDPINVTRLIQYVPAAKQRAAVSDFNAWNVKFNSRIGNLNKALRDTYQETDATKFKYLQDLAYYNDYASRKQDAFDKLALFELYGIGKYFFTEGGKDTKADRFNYLYDKFDFFEKNNLAPKKPTPPPVTAADASRYLGRFLASLQVGSSSLYEVLRDGVVPVAQADQDKCNPPPAVGYQEYCGSPTNRFAERTIPYCKMDLMDLIRSSFYNIKHALLKAGGEKDASFMELGKSSSNLCRGPNEEEEIAMPRVSSHHTSHYTKLVEFKLGQIQYVCPSANNIQKEVSGPLVKLDSKISTSYLTICGGSKRYLDSIEASYELDNNLIDLPVPPGCVGVNIIPDPKATGAIVKAEVHLNAALCNEEAWECRYGKSSETIVTDPKLVQYPADPSCPS